MMSRGGRTPDTLRLLLEPKEWKMYELVYQQALSCMLPTPALVHNRIVYRSDCALLLASASVRAKPKEEGYYFLKQDWPLFRWPTSSTLPALAISKIKRVQVRCALGPTPGQFLQTVFDPDWLCALSAERAIGVVFGLEPWDGVSTIERDRVPMAKLTEREATRQVELTTYAQRALKTWKDYGLVDSALAFASARNRMKAGSIDLKGALVEVVDEGGFPPDLADKVHRKMVDHLAHLRAVRANKKRPDVGSL